MTPQPIAHKPIPMETRVIIPGAAIGQADSLTGVVVGISYAHIFFSYIVLLDSPLQSPYGLQRAISVPGGILEAPDGSNWKR